MGLKLCGELLETLGDFTQNLITDTMAEGIIDALEILKIEVEERQSRGRSPWGMRQETAGRAEHPALPSPVAREL
nr:hypothetical protein [Synechococcus sp. CCY 9618]